MVKFSKESNGHLLTIEVDSSKLLFKIDEDIQEMKELQEKYEEYEKERIEAEENGDDTYDDWRYEYDVDRVYGNCENDYCTPDEIIKNREEFKEMINNIAMGDGSELWSKIQFKKNGTFKKNCKSILKEAINGSYWDDSYGWNALVMRIVPVNDILARVELDYIVIHY
jgi:hypothetical protein